MTFTVRQARTHAGFSQAEMANFLGVDRSTYIKIEKDPMRATVRQINLISQITGIPFSDLFLLHDSTKVDLLDQEEGLKTC